MRIIIPVFLFFAINNSFFAQNNGKVSGRVFDETGKSPVADATVQLTKTGDSATIAGTSTGADGSFLLTGIPNGKFRLHVKYIGYQALNLDNIVIDEGSKYKSFDSLKLKLSDATTQEIEVEANKSLMTLEGDKKVFNASQMMLTKGGTALDVLKKVPLVDVDINDNVTLRGSQNVKILIDDKPSRYASLKQVPSDVIEKVEIITNPPAKYEAEGVTGIINIVMKKSDLVGFTGSVNSGISYINKFRGWAGVDLNFKKKKWTFFSSVYTGLFNYEFNYTSLTQYYSPLSALTNIGGGNGNSKYFWGQVGSEYELSAGKTFGVEGSYSLGNWGNKDDSRNENLDGSGALTSYYIENAGRNGLWESLNANVYLNMKLNDKGRELNTSINFSRNKNTNDFFQVKHDYDANSNPLNNTPRDQRDSTQLKSYNINAQMDYTHPFSQATKIEAGYKGTFRINDNDFLSDTLNYDISNYVNDLSVTNRFKLSDYINAVYGVFSSSIGTRFSYKLGIRLEETNSTGELISNGTRFKKSYLDIFPSVNFSEKIGAANQAQLSYSRRITRPNIWRMNPFLNKHDARLWMMGNPNLNPEYTDSYEFSFMFSSKAVSVTPLLFFRHSKDIISAYSYLVDSSVSLTTFRNASGSNAYGTDLIMNSSALGWVNLNATLSLYYTKFDREAQTDYSAEEGFSWKANIRSTFNVGELFKIEIFYQYTGKKINAQGLNDPTSNFDIGVSKSFLKDDLTLSIKASDVFNTNKWGSETDAALYKTIFHNKWDSRLWFLNLSYNFGNTKEHYQKKNNTKRNSNENNDSQDSGNGN